jgi:hypothetical protein
LNTAAGGICESGCDLAPNLDLFFQETKKLHKQREGLDLIAKPQLVNFVHMAVAATNVPSYHFEARECGALLGVSSQIGFSLLSGVKNVRTSQKAMRAISSSVRSAT